MLRILPTSCDDLILPEECQDGAYLIAECLVDVGMSALYPFAPEMSGSCGSFVGFVTHAEGAHPDDVCNQLTVSIDSITPTRLGGTRAQICTSLWRVRYRLEAVFADFPTIERIENDVYLPSVQSIENSARWMSAVGVALTVAWEAALVDPPCPVLAASSNRQMTALMPDGPRGGCAGWRTTITVDVA